MHLFTAEDRPCPPVRVVRRWVVEALEGVASAKLNFGRPGAPVLWDCTSTPVAASFFSVYAVVLGEIPVCSETVRISRGPADSVKAARTSGSLDPLLRLFARRLRCRCAP